MGAFTTASSPLNSDLPNHHGCKFSSSCHCDEITPLIAPENAYKPASQTTKPTVMKSHALESGLHV